MKNYKSREQIIRDIDSALAKVKKAKAVAQEHLDHEKFLEGVTEQLSEYREHKEAADFQFRKIKRLEDVRLPVLKRKLAEFETLALLAPDTPMAKTPEPAPQPLTQPCASSDDVTP